MLRPYRLLASSALALNLLAGGALAADKPAHTGGPVDLAVANETKLMEMLKRSGRIGENATFTEAEQILRDYLKERAAQGQIQSKKMDSETAQMMANSHGATMQALQNANGNKLGIAKQQRPAPLQPENYDGETRTARVLAILMEFPDFPHNSIQAGESNMYYEDYTPQHYEDLLFSNSGFAGPAGENLLSMQQFYWQQSGNSYNVEGTVAGWYTAEYPAAFYGNNVNGDARALVREALLAAAEDPAVNLSDFDIEDRYDLDGDGNYWEADGLVDHVMIFHSSVGEEAGGGQLGEDAIWAHRWNLGSVFPIPGTISEVPDADWGEMLGAYDYTIQPADAAAGVVSHEYGHDLGLPDEYDTQYTGRGEPVSSWSVMSSGSWAGVIPGSEPTGFSAWAKEFLQHNHGGNWLHGATVALEDIPAEGLEALLDEAVHKGTNNDAVRIDLPQKRNDITVPASGEYAYYSGKGNRLNNYMLVPVDLSQASNAKVTFKAWYDIEQDWDYAFVATYSANGLISIPGNITTDTNPNGSSPGHGITGTSGGWVDAEFDLSAYAGQQFYLVLYYWTDAAVANPGFFADDIEITVDGNPVLVDGAEDSSAFGLAGFTRNPGYTLHDHYYLLEWRTHRGIDQGLAHVNVAGEMLPFNEGLVVWYRDTMYDNNWVGVHPGNGFLGVVDADQNANTWNDRTVASTRYQVRDAAFGIDKSEKVTLDLMDNYNLLLRDNYTQRNAVFDDSGDFSNAAIPDAGRAITSYGLKVRVVSQSDDKSVGKVLLYR
ncbi:immune inhibitor A domain-containing protein [Microbulbifer marinus]|uniref:Antibacterial peptide protease. Metallo peptidase. MEROPS family M06 n=1 Tax=Microbulbifer marinus TaxID=658218 RepID=A0A1H4AHG3_9GAMM|nr:immune inhibitor A domain-containing protein [Microbulbifer marinus]SEA35473.1 antibacterial peptide protease. Metallo peptidase. MEROPS family M06 [Microbulbifer marinus]